MQCNICGGTQFGAQGSRANVRCINCGSLERTRALKLHLDKLRPVGPQDRILHIAPDKGIAALLEKIAGENYEPADLFPENFPHVRARKFDLCADAEKIPPHTYDYIIHSHVLEHIPCNWTMALLYLHRALKPDGVHIMCIPILSGAFEECLAPLSKEEATKRFGQDDHVRRFGRLDLNNTLGHLFKGELEKHILQNCFSSEELDRVNIPHEERKTLNSSTVFVFKKDELRLAL